MKYHGGVEVADLTAPDVAAVRRGLVNLERHVETLRDVFGQKVVVAINHRAEDAPDEVKSVIGKDGIAEPKSAAERAALPSGTRVHWPESNTGPCLEG